MRMILWKDAESLRGQTVDHTPIVADHGHWHVCLHRQQTQDWRPFWGGTILLEHVSQYVYFPCP